MIHEENGLKCRCELVREVDLSDVLKKATLIRDKLAAKYGDPTEPANREAKTEKKIKIYLKALDEWRYLTPTEYRQIKEQMREQREQQKNKTLS